MTDTLVINRPSRRIEQRVKELTPFLDAVPPISVGEMVSVATTLWRDLNTPLCHQLLAWAEEGSSASWEKILRTKIDPRNYSSAEEYYDDAVASSFLRKHSGSGLVSVDPAQAAQQAVESAEKLCSETNRLFRARLGGRVLLRPLDEARLSVARRKIARVLGRFDASEWEGLCRFGPGSFAFGKGIYAYEKLSGEPTCTARFATLGHAMVNAVHAWVQARGGIPLGDFEFGPTREGQPIYLSIVPGGKTTTVRKTALVDRPIEIQPLVNLYAQMGIGAMIRKRLAHCGNSIKYQTRNQGLAKVGSLTGAFATIDLSSASDTIATELVRDLLPNDWFYAMDICRTHTAGPSLDQQAVLERFSSMGNGFTFELETLIFWAIASACCGGTAPVVYGDDIIVPTQYFDETCSMLTLCGFVPNKSKSFGADTSFRESCGRDYFLGQAVRPFYFDKDFNDKENVNPLFERLALANGIRRAAFRSNRGYGCDRRFKRAWLLVASRIPRPLRALTGPAILPEPSRDELLDREAVLFTEGDFWLIGDDLDEPISYTAQCIAQRTRMRLAVGLVAKDSVTISRAASAIGHMLYNARGQTEVGNFGHLARKPTHMWVKLLSREILSGIHGVGQPLDRGLPRPWGGVQAKLMWLNQPYECVEPTEWRWLDR